MFDCLDAKGRRNMRLTRTWSTDQDDILSCVHKLAAMELAHESFVDLAGGEVKAIIFN